MKPRYNVPLRPPAVKGRAPTHSLSPLSPITDHAPLGLLLLGFGIHVHFTRQSQVGRTSRSRQRRHADHHPRCHCH